MIRDISTDTEKDLTELTFSHSRIFPTGGGGHFRLIAAYFAQDAPPKTGAGIGILIHEENIAILFLGWLNTTSETAANGVFPRITSRRASALIR